MNPLIDLIARTPGALDAVMAPDLCAVLDRLDVTAVIDRAAAAVAGFDDPTEALQRAASSVGVLAHLTDTERAFADARYSDTLSDQLFAVDPDPLAQILGVPVGPRAADEVPPVPVRASSAYPLFPHQRRAVIRVQRHLRQADTRVLLHMPTGAGKTRSAINVVCDHLRARSPGVVVWAATTKELLEQAAREFHTAWSHLGNRDLAIGHGWDGETAEAALVEDGFVAATLQGLHALKGRNEGTFDHLVERCTLMVFDEAHQAIAPTYRDVTEHISDRARLLGLSATPGRTAVAADVADQKLAEFFGRTKVMLDTSEEGHSNPVRFLVDAGYLADTTFRVVPVDRPKSRGRVQAADAVPDDVYTEQVVSLLIEHAEAHRLMVFAASVDHAKTIAAASTGCGIPARYVIGEMGVQARRRAVDWFKQPSEGPKVIVNYGVLATGFDAPEVAASIIARPTGSLVLYSQMVGRAIRGPKAGGTPEALVLTVVDSDNPAFSNVAQAFENWEQLWEEVQ